MSHTIRQYSEKEGHKIKSWLRFDQIQNVTL